METLNCDSRRYRSKVEGDQVSRYDVGWFVPFCKGGGLWGEWGFNNL